MNFLTGFTSGLLLITLSELGDKTFFIGAILAMRHPRRWVFVGVTAALTAMTLLSVWIGQIASFFPQHYVKGIAVALFIGFGLKLLYDAIRMSGKETLDGEQAEAMEAVEQREKGIATWSARAVVMEAFTLTFIAEWGDRTQIATITLASSHHPYGVLLGAILGHAICAAMPSPAANSLPGASPSG
jgi:putative Ca2+/H+ antiporter (TMEM165/GDT1 family)